MKLIATTADAVGTVLCQDITQIIKGVTKDARFRKGHIVTEEDIPVLLSLGKDSLYVWEADDNLLHENDAADILAGLCENDYMERSQVKEGKIELMATVEGLFKVNSDAMRVINSFGQMMVASRHGNTRVSKGDKLCGTRIIPLVIEKDKMERAVASCKEKTKGAPIFEIMPYRHKKVGIITTGNEVFYKRIEDAFTPVIIDKLSEFDTEVIAHETFPDNDTQVTDCIIRMISAGADMVICTGGMSVDPDDRTPLAIKNTGADIVSYGAPVLPGAMFMLSYYQGDNGARIPIVGLPGCVMYARRTIFDLVLPRLMADDLISAEELSDMGEGGLCLNCPVCTYPNCGFGK